MLEDYTYMAKQSVVAAQEAARDLGNDRVGTEHLLLGLFLQGGNPSAKALADLGVEGDPLREAVEDAVGSGDSATAPPPFDVEARAALDEAGKEARALNSDRTGAEHLLLALVRERDTGAVRVLEKLGVDPDAVRPSVMKLLTGAPAPAPRATGGGAGKELGQILVDQGVITSGELDSALEGARDKLLGRALIDLGMINESDLVGALAVQIGLDFVKLDTYQVEPWAVQLVPAAAAWRHHVLPIGEKDGGLLVAMSNPADQHALDDIRVMTGRQVVPVVAMASDIEKALRLHYGSKDAAGSEELPLTSGKWAEPDGAADSDDWRGPSDSVLGTPIDLSPVLALTDTGVFVAVSDVVVYPTGMRLVVTLRRKAAPRPDKWFEAVSWQHRWQGAGIPELSPRSLRVGVEFPDGSRVDNLSFRELPSRRPPGPTLLSLGAEGSPWRVDVQYWVWPLPRSGTAAFFCEWPSEGVPLSRTEFDCAILAEAAEKAHILWDQA